ncbi:MAG: hypothetical protein LUQ11_03570 [Methylococcaceae bacterium]|nr:hypothetical protein [Methylococcaceae bacterium]
MLGNICAVIPARRRLLTPLVVGASSLCLLSTPVLAGPKTSQRDIALARNYVFAACVINRYQGSPLADEADAWASGLVEQGNLPAGMYSKLANLAKSAPMPEITRNGISMKLQSCVEFVDSSKFETQLKKLLRR